MTAEFYLENLSDLTRCIIVPIRKQLHLPDELTSTLVGRLMHHYSEWLTHHFYEEIQQFHYYVGKFASIIHMDQRITTNYACLYTAFRFLVHSMLELGLHADPAQALLKKVEEAILMSLEEHQTMIDNLKEKFLVGNLAFCILEGYKNNAFDLTKKIEKLRKHDGMLWKNDLCLRREALVSFVRQQSGYHDWTSNRITRDLKDLNALVLQEDETSTVKLKKDSPRVYRIRLNVLKETAQRY